MDTALDGAVRVFCERGYHATSIGELTAAMGLATGSVYKAFRDKHAVFVAAFERYATVRREQTRSAAARGANGREQLRNLLLSYVEHSQGSEGRRGCIVVGSAVELSAVDPVIRARVTAQLKTNESFIAGLIRAGQADGSNSGPCRGRRHRAADNLHDAGPARRRQGAPAARRRALGRGRDEIACLNSCRIRKRLFPISGDFEVSEILE